MTFYTIMSYIMDTLSLHIANKISVLRKQRKWTQAALAKKAGGGVRRQDISEMENAHWKGSIGKVQRVVMVLGYTLDITPFRYPTIDEVTELLKDED